MVALLVKKGYNERVLRKCRSKFKNATAAAVAAGTARPTAGHIFNKKGRPPAISASRLQHAAQQTYLACTIGYGDERDEVHSSAIYNNKNTKEAALKSAARLTSIDRGKQVNEGHGKEISARALRRYAKAIDILPPGA